jgi:kynureninase
MSPERIAALAAVRAGFELPRDQVYLDGNSLGALHARVRARLATVVSEEWGNSLIAGWNDHHWIDLPLTVGDRLAPLLGAGPGEVLCCDSLSVNLFKAFAAALEINAPRTRIVTEASHFPTDNYIARGISALLGVERCQVDALPMADIAQLDFDDVAVLSLSHVNFRTGALRDLGELTQRAHAGGALVLWDLAHSAGVVETQLGAHEADLAVGCTYKFLNGGPGAPGFLYMARRHQWAGNAIPGWMGHADRFAFEADYRPVEGIARFLTGTQSVVAMSAVDAALSVFDDIDIPSLRAQSLALSDGFLQALAGHEATRQLECLTPLNHAARGSQISLRLEHGFPVSQALIADGVVVDFRDPDIVRFGFSPLYNTQDDVHTAAARLADILDSKRHELRQFTTRKTVT